MNNLNVKDIALNAIFGASYVALVFVFQFLSFDLIQFRIAEVLLVFLLFNKRLTPGLILGTLVANIAFSPFGIVDALVGTLATIVAVVLMILFKKRPLISLIMPALSNGLIVGLMIYIMSFSETNIPFIVSFLWVFLGEAVVMYVIGYPVYLYINRNKNIKELIV